MTSGKTALLLGGTGALGAHLSRLLSSDGWDVTVTTRTAAHCPEGAAFAVGNAKDPAFLRDILASSPWDVVVDFMIWTTREFEGVSDLLLSSCSQYVFLSSYRVFSAADVVNERSPRLLDCCGDAEYLATDEYALAKARQEDRLRFSERDNWTIVRPSITYSKGRHQLGCLECYEWLPRALFDHAVPVPTEMLATQATMTWGGDAALMISRLCGCACALGEDYNVCTSRHRPWSEVARVYDSYVPLRLSECAASEFESRLAWKKYQIRYDRLVDRVMDNSKALSACGLVESDLVSLEEGFEREFAPYLGALPAVWTGGPRLQGNLDRMTGDFWAPQSFPFEGRSSYCKYLFGRFVG